MLEDPLLEDLLLGSRAELLRFANVLDSERPGLVTTVTETTSSPRASSQRLQIAAGSQRVSVDIVIGTRVWWDKTVQWHVVSGIALGGGEDDDPCGPDLAIAIGESTVNRARRFADWLEDLGPFLAKWQPEVLAALERR
ncbi:hypothetical protein BH10PSE17_BH10PSE17_24900 [soil metagenome]